MHSAYSAIRLPSKHTALQSQS